MKERRNILFVIGINEYESPVWKNLGNAVIDAQKIINLLTERYSFELYPEPLFDSNATKQNIYDSFNSLKVYVEPEDNLIIFFAGHGEMNPHTHRGYWIPHEGTSSITTFIENSVTKDFIADINSKHIWLIADSCFSGTFLSNTRSRVNEKTYFELDQLKSKWMFASGGEEIVSDGQIGLHSPFSRYLIKFLEENTNIYTCVSEIISYTTSLTKTYSNQTPRGAFIDNIGHEGGELILALKDEFVKHNIIKTRGISNTPNLGNELRLNRKSEKTISTGKEILFVKSFVDDVDFLILELFRFEDDGSKRVSFKSNYVTIGQEEIILIQRFATWEGFDRYLESNINNYKDSTIVSIPAHEDIDEVEDSIYAIEQAEYLTELLSFNKDRMTCLHCGEKLSTNDGFMIEIDEIGLNDNFGSVHKLCLRPADRILGQTGYEDLEESHLINFNYDLWYELYIRGQGQLRTAYKNLKKNDNLLALILWNQEHNHNEGLYCIKINYENGSSSFMMLGKEIQRFKKNLIDSELDFFNKTIKEFTKRGDSYGMIVESKLKGNYSLLNKLKEPEQTITLVLNYEKILYSKQFEEEKGDIDNDYTPLGLIYDSITEEIVKVENYIPIISNPFEYENYHQNWNESGLNLDKVTLKIISSDLELDSYLQKFFIENMQPIIDPIFDSNTMELKSGIKIADFKSFVDEAKKFRQGDRVEIILPENRSNMSPSGILLSDEFLSEEGVLSVIFQPIQDGKILEDMQFQVPVELLRKIV